MIKVKINRKTARKVGLGLFEVGAAAFLIGGLSLDGPDLLPAIILTGVPLAVAISGYVLYRATEVRIPCKVKPVVDKKRLAKRRDQVFSTWMKHGTLTGPKLYK